ncbi:SUMO-activating enzyme subunit 2 [Nymphon striatum]|nr:SUMO-activating enzyme subunit 2 [Nymphon striatum]
MAASIKGIVVDELKERIENAKLLMVGAGGIGCELLKNLVLTGFKDITVIDLDTIDVSNLNRQFLFQKQHVGKSKAKVIIEKCDFDMCSEKDSARNHVNRMCLAAEVPLVESGTSGYLGQVTVIKKSFTECYECNPKPAQKTFPGCTIRNTPSEPIHCIVWAKHLFNQLFGEADPDEDVSPDTADPEAAGVAGTEALTQNETNSGNVERVSTRSWASENKYNPAKLFRKLFQDDIHYLLSMDKLWKDRRPPTPLDWNKLPEEIIENENNCMNDQKVWSIKECVQNFSDSINLLKTRLNESSDSNLFWDKDDNDSMDFVTACANIRAYIFGISKKSKFDVKSMAGNIIPAIATTNAIISGLIVMEMIKVLLGRLKDCKTVYLNRKPNHRKRILATCQLEKPNPKCYVCSEKPEVTVRLNTEEFTIKTFEDKILKSQLNMVAPDVEIDDGKGTILISSEEGETEQNNDRHLSEFGIRNGSRLKCDDFLQVLELRINILQSNDLEDGKEFEILGDLSQIQAKPESSKEITSNEASQKEPSPSEGVCEIDDDLIIMDVEEVTNATISRKRKRDNDDDALPVKKKIERKADDAIEIL